MAIQALSNPPPALLPALNPDSRDQRRQQQDTSRNQTRPGSPITITRVDQQDYPDGYVVTTTTYENKGVSIKSTPKTQAPPLVPGRFDLRSGPQLSTLLAAQESGQRPAVVAVNPYRS